MHFNVLNYFLIFVLIIKGYINSNSLQGALYPYILNEVSDFSDIVEKSYQSDPNLQYKEESELPQRDYPRELRKNPYSYETFTNDANDDNVFSSSELSVSESDKDNLCPKHDIKHRYPLAIPQKLFKMVSQEGKMEESDQKKPLVYWSSKQGEHVDFKPTKTVTIKESNIPSRANVREKFNEIEDNDAREQDKSNTYIPDFIYDFDNAKEDESCENCNKIKGLFPIPLVESILINKLLESNDVAKHYPIKYIIKSVMPNLQNVEELDKSKIQRCLKSYLQRRKRQLQYLKKRNIKQKKLHNNKKTPKKKKIKKKKNQGKKHRHHRSVNNNFESQLNGMIAYVAKNQTFNDTFTYMPLVFGTVTPADGQILIAGIKHDASQEEKIMLQKILRIQPDHLSNSSITPEINQTTQGIQTSSESTVTNHISSQSIQDTVKYNLNLSLSLPEVKKTVMEIMQRQQDIGTYKALTNKVKREALTSAATSPTSASSPICSTSESGTLGLVVTSPTAPNEVNVVPGILIYPKSSKQRKRFASDMPETSGSNFLNQAEINTILKNIASSPNEKNNAYLESANSKKQCKTDRCVDETDKIMDALNGLNHPSLKSEELEFDASTLFPPLSSPPSPLPQLAFDHQNPNFNPTPEIEGKLLKLQKDLKMVKEIQNIFDGIANIKKVHQKKKRNVISKADNKKIRHFGTENRYDYALSGFIKARVWRKNNKSYCEDKVKSHYLRKRRSRRFLAEN